MPWLHLPSPSASGIKTEPSHVNDEKRGLTIMPISEARKAELRESIIDAAIQEFLTQGYAESSVAAITRKAGGSKTNIYTYFGGKDGLFLASMEVLCKKILFPLCSINLPEGDVGQALFHFGSAFLQAILSEPAIRLVRLIIAESARFPTLAGIFLDSGPNYAHQVLAAYIERGPVRRCFRTDAKAALVATLFLNMISRDQQMRLLLGVGDPPTALQKSAIIKSAVALLIGSAP
jgi:AcrR family transcriptional regulator